MMQQSKLSNQDTNVIFGFFLFVLVKVHRDIFLSEFPRIIKIAYRNDLLLRYGLLIILLAIYSLLPYVLIISIYFLPEYLYVNKIFHVELDNQSWRLLYLFSCVSLFIFLKNQFVNTIRLNHAIISIAVVILIPFFLQLLYFINILDFCLYLLIFLSFLSLVINKGIKSIHSIMIFYLVILSFNHFSLQKLIRIIKFEKKTAIVISLFFTGTVIITNIHYLFKFFAIYVLSSTILIMLSFDEYEKLKTFFVSNRFSRFFKTDNQIVIKDWFHLFVRISQKIIIAIPKLFEEIFRYFVFTILFLFSIFIRLIKYIKQHLMIIFKLLVMLTLYLLQLWIIFPYMDIIFYYGEFISTTFFLLMSFIAFLALLFFVYHYSIIANLFPNWWFSRRYKHLFNQDVDIIYQSFHDEPSRQGRKSILQFIPTSDSSPNQKLKALARMMEHEKQDKDNVSHEVVDAISQIRQIIQKQRQTQSIGNVSPIGQTIDKIMDFDFTDPILENNRTATLSPIDSARQQLLEWLKGETPENPSIDKLLIQQWNDYEIGIGLKYSGQMGGDFYDLFQLPRSTNADNKMGLFISNFGLLVGDLTGHGVETAVNLSKTHNFWAETDLSQDAITTMRAFEQNFKTTFHPFSNDEGCELCYVQLKENEITLSRAGLHLGLIREHQWHTIALPPDENFCALGNWPSLPVKRYTRVELKAYDTLIVYTDGLFENRNQHGEQFGEDKLIDLFLAQHRLEMNTFIDTVFRTVYEHCQPEPIEDDETLLVIRRVSSIADLGD